MNKAARKLDSVEKKLLCRIEKVLEELKHCKDQIDSNRCDIERWHKRAETEHHDEQKKNYSQFAEKKSKNLFTLKNYMQYVRQV